MRLRLIATAELVLILPAVLFMSALVVRSLPPLQYELARSAQHLVMWYTGRIWTLWVFLLGLPLIALVTGCAALLYNWNHDLALSDAIRQSLGLIRARLATLFIFAATLAAGVILAIVVLHMLAN
jgi:ABC-type Fe3+-siderophore transport system permease subunit